MDKDKLRLLEAFRMFKDEELNALSHLIFYSAPDEDVINKLIENLQIVIEEREKEMKL